MGFRVELEGGKDTDRMLARLRASPMNTFPQPFPGYLLFLFTGQERELVARFQKMIVELDSLTGETVAFAVFVKRFSMKVEDAGERNSRRPAEFETRQPKSAEFETTELRWDISSLVKEGRVGWIAKGDELIALTYATDEVATELGLLSFLPCVVAFDGVPSGKFKAIRLTDDFLKSLAKPLRSSIDQLRKLPNFQRYASLLTEIYETEAAPLRISRVIQAVKAAENDIIVSLKLSGRLSHIRKVVISQFKNSPLLHLLPHYGTDKWNRFVDDALNPFQRQLRDLRRAYSSIRNLMECDQFMWPLSDVNMRRVKYVYAMCEHLNRPRAELASISLAEIQFDRSELVKKANDLERDLLSSIEESLLTKLGKLAQLQFNAQAASVAGDRVLDLVVSAQDLGVSFSQIFAEEVSKTKRRLLLERGRNDLVRFIRPWLRPQTLLSLARLTTSG